MLLPVWPRDAKSLDTSAREKSQGKSLSKNVFVFFLERRGERIPYEVLQEVVLLPLRANWLVVGVVDKEFSPEKVDWYPSSHVLSWSFSFVPHHKEIQYHLVRNI